MAELVREYYYSGDIEREMYPMEWEEGQKVFDQVKAKFPWAKASDYFCISTPAVHEVLNETVVSCGMLHDQTRFLVGDIPLGSARKFCLDSGTSYIRIYKMYMADKPSWLPPSAKVLFESENVEEYNRPFPSQARRFHDIYLTADPAEMEGLFKLPVRRGKYETYYGVTVVNDQPVRVKQYLYDDQTGFSDWDVIYFMKQKKLNANS